MQEVSLRPHQVDAVRRLHNGSILCGGVGTGKSRVALKYYVEREAPKDVYVITTAKKRDSFDWESEAILHGIGTVESFSTPGHSLGRITVDSWNNMWRYADVEGAFFIFDEQRLVGSGAWVGTFKKISSKNRWILLSATPGDTWLDYIPVFVANGFYKNRTEFLREHVVYNRFSKFPKVDRYIAVGRLVRHKNSLLVEMPYERHTTRKLIDVPVEYDQALFDKVVKQRWHVYENRPLRDVAELYSVMRRVVNSDASRMEEIIRIWETHPKLIVFYNFDYELEILRTLGVPVSPSKTKESNGSCIRLDGAKNSEKSTGKTCSNSEETLPPCPWVSSQGCSCTQTKSESCPLISLASSNNESEKALKDAPESLTSSGSRQTSAQSPDVTGSLMNVCSSDQRQKITDTQQALECGLTGVEPKTESSTTGSPTNTVSFAEWNGHRHQAIPTTDRWVYLVQYTAGAEGWNCIETDTCVFYSLNYSYRTFEQCQGRTDRLNTPYTDLYYYVLKSNSLIDKMIWQALKVKKRFNEARSEDEFRRRISAV